MTMTTTMMMQSCTRSLKHDCIIIVGGSGSGGEDDDDDDDDDAIMLQGPGGEEFGQSGSTNATPYIVTVVVASVALGISFGMLFRYLLNRRTLKNSELYSSINLEVQNTV